MKKALIVGAFILYFLSLFIAAIKGKPDIAAVIMGGACFALILSKEA